MEKFKRLLEARVNFGDKGDILVIDTKNIPTSFYVIKKKDIEKEFSDSDLVHDIKRISGKTGAVLDEPMYKKVFVSL